MRSRKTAALGLVLVSILTSGCASLFQRSGEFQITKIGPERTDDESSAFRALDAGRQALANDNFGAAIAVFREARLRSETAAEAYNGMAIAYSRIGRPDLAERFFRQAIANAPDDRRYYRNLARLHAQDSEKALRTTPNAQMVGTSDATSPGMHGGKARLMTSRDGNAVIRIELPVSRLARMSPNEVQIGTMVTAPQPSRALRTGVLAVAAAPSMRRRNPNYDNKDTIVRAPVVQAAVTYPSRISLLTKD